MNSTTPTSSTTPMSPRWSLGWRCLVSLWLLYHAAGLLVSPASIPPSSQFVRNAWVFFGPYLQFMYMNQGHHFFAPDPGPSTLVSYEVERANGTTVSGRIPNLDIQPRLLYHRHFMLTESLGAYEGDERLQPLLVRALARQLCREHEGDAITLTKVTHMLPTMDWLRAGERIDDPSLYQEQPLGRFEWSDFSQP